MTAAHAFGFNSGTVGVALLGTLSTRDATPAARDTLIGFLAWEAELQGIDPTGASTFVNPVSGEQKVFANIAGHRDVNATDCPGGRFYDTLPALRTSVAARIAAGSATTTSTVASPTTSSSTTTTVKRGRKP